MTAVTHIPLAQLHSTSINVRKTGGLSVDDLAASIAAHGLIHNLVVTVGTALGQGGLGGYLVVAGGRRLRALSKLQAEDRLPASLAGGIPCRVIERENALETSLAENTIREAMHPADEFDAFYKLTDADIGGGCSVEEIAARVGKPQIYVRQRLRLANVAPAILDDYRAGKATLEQMMALALTDDQLQQLHVWKGAKQEWQREPRRLREAITQQELAADSMLAKYLGVAAYEKAGGQVRRDVFGTDEHSYLMDAELAKKLALEKLARTAEKIRKEGWLWVEARLKYDHYTHRDGFGSAPSEYRGGKETWNAEAKAHAGAIVSLGYNGQAEIKRGLVRPEDRKAAAKATGSEVSGGKAKPERKPGELSFAAVQRLQAEATAIVQFEVAGSTRTALALLAAQLADRAFFDGMLRDGSDGPRRWVHVSRDASGRVPTLLRDIADVSPAGKDMAALEQYWRDRLPKKRGEVRDWLLQQEFEAIAKLLAFLVAREIDVIDISDGAKAGVTEAAEAVKADLSARWRVTEEWLATLPKATILALAKDAGAGDLALAEAAKTPKAKLPAMVLKLFPDGWLPKPLRPRAAKKAGKKRPAVESEA